jgi:dTDP-glucose pyrophosphorylase
VKSKLISENSKMNILIPMAGLGTRFDVNIYKYPKPFITIKEKSMIEEAIESLKIKGNIILIVSKEQLNKYKRAREVISKLKKQYENIIIIESDNALQGAATTCLEAKEYINNNEGLLIANSDQIMTWDGREFFNYLANNNDDGVIVTYTSISPKNSYVSLDKNKKVLKVVEKKVISNIASIGLYYWKQGEMFVNDCADMVSKEIKELGEYYVAPVYNESIKKNRIISIYPTSDFFLVGTPEDLNNYRNI